MFDPPVLESRNRRNDDKVQCPLISRRESPSSLQAFPCSPLQQMSKTDGLSKNKQFQVLNNPVCRFLGLAFFSFKSSVSKGVLFS